MRIPRLAKSRLGFAGKSTILTFGLLSKNKGIEVMIDAMPGILGRKPDAVYVVLGATHPNLVRDQGEEYRESLVTRVRERGVEKHVVFLDQFVDKPTLLDFISMCDVYVTPYLNESQMTSGTLAYSFGMGKVVVSTPYWHAQELLADGRGVLVPFNDVCSHWHGNRGSADRRLAAGANAETRLREQSFDDLGADRLELCCCIRRASVAGSPRRSPRCANEFKPLVTNPPPRSEARTFRAHV